MSVLGPSGCGKSVLLKHINGLIRPDAGQVLVDGLDVTQLSRKELTTLRTRIGYVFQFGALFDSMNVYENIRLGFSDDAQYKDQAFCRERVAVFDLLRAVRVAAWAFRFGRSTAVPREAPERSPSASAPNSITAAICAPTRMTTQLTYSHTSVKGSWASAP